MLHLRHRLNCAPIAQTACARGCESRGSSAIADMYDTIRYDTRCYFNVRSKADTSQLNLQHGTDN